MKKLALAGSLCFALIVSCGNKQGDVQRQDPGKENQTDVTKPGKNNGADSEKVRQTDYKLQPYEVIIKPSDAEFKDIFGDKYKSRVPDNSEIQTAENLLKDCFDKQKSGTVNRLLNRTLDEYNRQFAGASDSSGDKILWINCFARPEKDYDEWKHKLIIAKGGGNSFFSLMTNISRDTYYDMVVNGPK